ncbi:unnamed protein product [Rhodiola kirilowii]
MHDKYDYSDITCSSSSSPSSPKRSVLYYVDSPSSRSESNNDVASPLYSPTPTPPPPPPPPRGAGTSSLSPSSSYRPSSSRLSSSTPSPLLGRSRKPQNCRSSSAYYCYAIREDEVTEDNDCDDDEINRRRHYYYQQNYKQTYYSKPCQTFSIAVLGFGVLFGFFCLILWGTAQPFKPAIAVKSFTTHNLDLGVGTDYTGVPTRLLTLNCSVDIAVHNTATFFGIDLLSDSLELMYSRLTIATGEIRKYYQPRKSHRRLKVKVEGYQVPLYGVGESLAKSDRQGRVPVRLVFRVLSKGNVIGKFLRVKHRRHASCSLFIADSDLNKAIKLDNDSCIYS